MVMLNLELDQDGYLQILTILKKKEIKLSITHY